MKQKNTLKYIISCICFLGSLISWSQNNEQVKDTVTYQDRYGLRVGVDLFRPVLSVFDDSHGGFEIVGDYRFADRFYMATELGYSDFKGKEDYFKYKTNGSYIKLGVDFNTYKNWLGMENMIYVGLRYGFSTFEQTVEEYTINADPSLPLHTDGAPTSYDGLTAHWAEAVMGIKVEVLHNVFMGFSFRASKLFASDEPDNFKNLYIPGFNRVYMNDGGWGFNYTLSYLIPFKKK